MTPDILDRLVNRQQADNARVDAALAALQVRQKAEHHESRSPDGDGLGREGRPAKVQPSAAGRDNREAGLEPADSRSITKYVVRCKVDGLYLAGMGAPFGTIWIGNQECAYHFEGMSLSEAWIVSRLNSDEFVSIPVKG